MHKIIIIFLLLITQLNVSCYYIMDRDNPNDHMNIKSVESEDIKVTGVKLDSTNATITVGNTLQLVATITPTNATNKDLTWSTSKSSIATITSSGILTGVTAGSVNITVTTVDGGYIASCSVLVIYDFL